MTREEAKRILDNNNLSNYIWFDNSRNEPNYVGINESENVYEVFATSERGTPSGIKVFSSEEEALTNFISRVESLNRLLKKISKWFLDYEHFRS
ncbi:Imm59 family immunity protein [Listeria cornellensis]|uniref:Uncharacterized protein n=1 Tax=Listeria cornellensis FSL F6-0969 TaxID=1265820 RepID=W7BXZ1_9LIST|nr:Imm59 family immunity protein [Listeria cornellensis]EUJ29585.1 hypothetical protein PCORN_10512 [Listeria cornellensis FSL F6-0969]